MSCQIVYLLCALQWRRSVVKSEGVRVSQVKPSNQKPTDIRFRLVIFGFFVFGRNEFSFSFYFSVSFQKSHLRWAENVMFASEP